MGAPPPEPTINMGELLKAITQAFECTGQRYLEVQGWSRELNEHMQNQFSGVQDAVKGIHAYLGHLHNRLEIIQTYMQGLHHEHEKARQSSHDTQNSMNGFSENVKNEFQKIWSHLKALRNEVKDVSKKCEGLTGMINALQAKHDALHLAYEKLAQDLHNLQGGLASMNQSGVVPEIAMQQMQENVAKHAMGQVSNFLSANAPENPQVPVELKQQVDMLERNLKYLTGRVESWDMDPTENMDELDEDQGVPLNTPPNLMMPL